MSSSEPSLITRMILLLAFTLRSRVTLSVIVTASFNAGTKNTHK